MNIIGLEDVTAFSFGGAPSLARSRTPKRTSEGPELRVRPWQVASVIAITLAAGIVSAGANGPGLSHAARPPPNAHGGEFTPLGEALLRDAWKGAHALLLAEGANVPQLLQAAGARVDAWRSFERGDVDGDDTDET